MEDFDINSIVLDDEDEEQEQEEQATLSAEKEAIENSYVSVADDKMSVMLNLSSPNSENPYKVADIMKILRHHDIKQGISTKKLQEIIDEKLYFQDIMVATGKPAVDGDDGYFVYHFKTDTSAIPKMLEDGSVDYKNMELFEEVKSGQLLAEYKPATPGEYGYTVYGSLLKPRRGKELPPLRIKGIVLSEDKRKYFAAMDGMIEHEEKKLEVKRLYTVNGDVDIVTGNIDFSGDVHIKGNVQTGFTIRAGGNVVVDGSVEAAKIYSGKNILLKKGIQGNSVGELIAEGTVSGVFFESVHVEAGDRITADYLLHCDVASEEKVVVSGKKGAIIGGKTRGKLGVECTTLGNMVEVTTRVEVGIDKAVVERHQEIGKLIVKTDSEIKLFEEGIRKVSLKPVQDKKTISFYNKLRQAMQIKKQERENLLKERNEIMKLVDSANHSKIIVRGVVFPGVKTVIDTNLYIVKDAYKGVIFVRNGNKVVAISE